MMHEVPDADVVVTNPVRLAVALKYDAKTMGAPRIVAKGARLMAERIREAAVEHNVPIVENQTTGASPLQGCGNRSGNSFASVQGCG